MLIADAHRERVAAHSPVRERSCHSIFGSDGSVTSKIENAAGTCSWAM